MYNENEKLKINSIMEMSEYLIEMKWRRTNTILVQQNFIPKV